ncbi:MAG: hypothetical protein KJS64_06615 [Acidobacteria bacterium]|nr:hypothetical protein [Acidobacteriota bacterium]
MSILHGVVFVAHLVVSFGTVVVLLVMRYDAQSGRLTTSPPRRNLAVRLAHLVPVTGAGVVVTSHGEMRWSASWIAVGAVCYVVAAYLIECRAVPAERRLRHHGVASDARIVVKSVEWSLALFAVAALAMLVQW